MKAMTSMLRCWALLLGCVLAGGCAAGGDDQNYKILQDDPPGSTPGEPFSLRQAAPLLLAMTNPQVQDNVAPQTLPTTVPSAQPGALAIPTQPTRVVDLDRSSWPTIVVTPASGVVWHHPVYFKDLPAGQRTVNPATEPDIEKAMQAALSQDQDPLLSPQGRLHTIIQPLKFGADMILFPVRAVINPPWTWVYTP